MLETPVTNVARRVPQLRVQFLPMTDQLADIPSRPEADRNVCPTMALALHSDIPSLEYWLDINA
jgi:hypothetical protein